MKKTIISLSIISLLTGCGGGGGGSSTPDNKKPAPTVDFPLKGATFDAAKLNSTTISIKEYNSSFMEDDALVETNYEKSIYQAIDSSDIAKYDILNVLANEEGVEGFFSVSTTEYKDAGLTQQTDQDSSFGGEIADKHFITYIDEEADKEHQLWGLPDFIANGDFALAQQGKYQATFESKLSGLSRDDIQHLLEDNGVQEGNENITHCDDLSVTRTFDFTRSSTEILTINSKKIETTKFYVRDRITGQCYGATDWDMITLMAHRNNDPVGLEVWANPSLGLVKGIEKNDSKKEAYLVELVDFSMNQ
ncbi:hypothetical protein [Photobacterium sp. DNB22_13_2]